jgi:hypothetical protein
MSTKMTVTEFQVADAIAHVVADPELSPNGIIRGVLVRLGVTIEPTPDLHAAAEKVTGPEGISDMLSGFTDLELAQAGIV